MRMLSSLAGLGMKPTSQPSLTSLPIHQLLSYFSLMCRNSRISNETAPPCTGESSSMAPSYATLVRTANATGLLCKRMILYKNWSITIYIFRVDLPSLYPTGLRPDVPFLAEAIPFPRLATDRMTVVSSSSRQNPAKYKAIPILKHMHIPKQYIHIYSFKHFLYSIHCSRLSAKTYTFYIYLVARTFQLNWTFANGLWVRGFLGTPVFSE